MMNRSQSHKNLHNRCHIIRVTIRPQSQLLSNRHNAFTISNTSIHQQNHKKHANTSKVSVYPANITPTNISDSSISQSVSLPWSCNSSEIELHGNDVQKHGIHPSKATFSNQKNIATIRGKNQIQDEWLDWTSFHDEHHRYTKIQKKNKCSPLCIILSILSGLLVVTIATILLSVLLTRKNNNVITIYPEAVLRWNSTGITIAGVVGQLGNASNQLNVPFGLAIDWSYTLYVADWSNHRVQKFLRNSSIGTTVAGQTIGSYNSTPNSLHYPGDVSVDWNGNIYVADTFNNRIQLWTSGSSAGIQIAGTGAVGNANNELNRPHGFARDPNTGILYISDTSNHRVMRYLPGATTGDLVAGGYGSGTNNNQLYSPFGIYFDSPSNSLIIANGYANNIVRWTLGASTWTVVAGKMNGTSGNSSEELNLPMDVMLDPMGNIYVADRLNHRIQFFAPGQTNGTTIAGVTGISSTNAISLNTPMSLTLDSQLNLYVADTFNSRVQMFARY